MNTKMSFYFKREQLDTVQRYAWPLGSSSPEDTVTAVFDIPAVFETIENSGTEILTPDETMYEEIRELCKPIYKAIEQSVSEENVKAYIGE